LAQPSAAVPAATPQPETPAQAQPGINTPVFKASTRLTVEDVTVTDGRHMPVQGLMQPNFTIKEDGKPQSIRNFEEYGTQRPPDQPALEQQPTNVYSNAPRPAPTTSAVNVLLLDDVNTGGLGNRLAKTPENVAYAKQKSMKYLGNMPAGTEVAILQMGSTLKVLQDFTSDRAVLLAAMKSATYKPVDGTYIDEPRDEAEVCAAANLRSEFTVNALAQAAAFLSGIKGRKNLLWFTPGTPWLFEYPAYSRISCLNDDTQQLSKAYAVLNAAEVAVYPIDPRGLSGNPAQSVDFQPNSNPQAAAMAQAAFPSTAIAEHNSLRDIADATGGVAYYNRNDLDAAIGEAIQTGEDYYSLSYVPPLSKYDGKYHTIEVKVDRPNLHLEYRAGYTSVDPAKALETPESSAAKAAPAPERELFAAMGHGAAGSTQLLFEVRVAPSAVPAKPGDPEIGTLSPALKRRPLVRYDFSYSLAPDQITLMEGPDGTRKGSVEFLFTAYDGAGQMLNVIGQTLNITLRPNEFAEFMQRPFKVPLKFDLPSGEIFVRLGVMDVASEKLGTLEIPETVAK
jgi:VWFA-related protein